ncbi:MAG: hypothetical protein E7K14_05445 [Bacillota bacterium]|nr:hypothetical protein [Bacillota bacterium]
MFQSPVPGVGDASVLLVDDLESGVHGRAFVQQCRTFVGRAVVNADGLPVLEGLGQEGIQAFPKIGACIINGNDDADAGAFRRLGLKHGIEIERQGMEE